MGDSKLPALPGITVPDLLDLGYLVDVSDTTDDPTGSSKYAALNCQLGLIPTIPAGRLGLENDVYVSTTNQTAKSTLYWNPSPHGGHMRLHDGTRWNLYVIDAPLSLPLAGLTNGKNYDVWGRLSSGSPALELSAAWTNDTTRAEAIARVSGVMCKSGDASRLYIGTIRTTSETTTEDSIVIGSQSGGKAFVWNAYNQVIKALCVYDTTDTWTLMTTNTWRQAGGASGNKVEFVCGEPTCYRARVQGHAYHSAANKIASVAIGEDSVSSPSGIYSGVASTGALSLSVHGFASKIVPPGYHYLAWLESQGPGAGTLTWYGDAGSSLFRNGLTAEIQG